MVTISRKCTAYIVDSNEFRKLFWGLSAAIFPQFGTARAVANKLLSIRIINKISNLHAILSSIIRHEKLAADRQLKVGTKGLKLSAYD